MDKECVIDKARIANETWWAKYAPVEREILSAREKRQVNAARRRAEKSRWFGDLCEATQGLAVLWRNNGVSVTEQFVQAEGDVLTCLCLARYHRQRMSRALDRLRHQVKRPFYYAAENARRRALAEARRSITRRTTVNACPTREDILDAWLKRRSSHAAAIRFGSLIEDLECYLDNALIRDEGGNIVGRKGGIKRWLQTEIPALYLRYTTVMRFKTAARKLRQITEVSDPTPAARIVEEAKIATGPAYILRARAIWTEVISGVKPSSTALMERLDALLDPERVEEANLLTAWRTRYENEITVRTKLKSSFSEDTRRIAPPISTATSTRLHLFLPPPISGLTNLK